jgi:hypothetical protein
MGEFLYAVNSGLNPLIDSFGKRWAALYRHVPEVVLQTTIWADLGVNIENRK